MASTDYPLSVSSKFIDDAGTEHLVTVRGRNLDDFQGRLNEAGHIFPYAGFRSAQPAATVTPPIASAPDMTPATDAAGNVAPAPTPINTGNPRPVNAGPPNANAPKCAEHHRPMRPSRNGGWYCPAKTDDGSYCQSRVA